MTHPTTGTKTTMARFFVERDFESLATVKGQGRFLLSINDTPQIRAWFTQSDRYQMKTHYTLGLHAVVGKKQVRELLYTNLAPEAMKTVKVASPYPQHRKDKEKQTCEGIQEMRCPHCNSLLAKATPVDNNTTLVQRSCAQKRG